MFWGVKLCDLIHLFSPEDEGSMVVQNTGNRLLVYAVSPARSLQPLLEEIQCLRINIHLGSLHIDNK